MGVYQFIYYFVYKRHMMREGSKNKWEDFLLYYLHVFLFMTVIVWYFNNVIFSWTNCQLKRI